MNLTVTIAEATSRLSELIDQLEPGQELTICKGDVACAKIVSLIRPINKSKPGRAKGQITILGDITGPIIPEEDYMCLHGDV